MAWGVWGARLFSACMAVACIWTPFYGQLIDRLGFGFALPVLYPLTLAFFLISVVVDRSGLLRVFRGVLVTSDKLVLLLAMIDTCPWALLLHAL